MENISFALFMFVVFGVLIFAVVISVTLAEMIDFLQEREGMRRRKRKPKGDRLKKALERAEKYEMEKGRQRQAKKEKKK